MTSVHPEVHRSGRRAECRLARLGLGTSGSKSPRTRARGLLSALLALTVLLVAACGPRVPPPAVEGTARPGGAAPSVTAPVDPADPAGGDAQGPEIVGGALPLPTDPAAAPTGPAAPAPGQPPPAPGAPQPAPAPGSAAPPPPAAAAMPPPLDGPLGSLCRTYLRPEVASLVIEIDAQAGAELPAPVIEHLLATLTAVLDKPGGITVDTSGRIEGRAQAWTLDSIRATAAASRSVAQTPDTVVMHIISLRGQPDQTAPGEGQPDIRSSIGVAFAAGEFVIFPDRVEGLAALLGGVNAVLRSVTVHEAGHLLCLINLDYTSNIPHEDPAHPGHSVDRNSVMFHAIETTAIGQLFSGPPPNSFTANDLADLEGLRTGRY